MTRTTHVHDISMRVRTALSVFTIIGLAFMILALTPSPSEAHDGLCELGEVCHYSEFDADSSAPHMEHVGDNDNWNSQFSVMVENDWSVVNKGQTGMAVETMSGFWGFGSRNYCVTNSGSVWNLRASGGDGRAHYWFWDGPNDNCL